MGIVDTHRTILVGMAAMINAREGFHVVAAGRTVAELMMVSRRMDIVLLDAKSSLGAPVEADVSSLIAIGARVLLLVDETIPGGRVRALPAGVSGAVRRSDDGSHLATRIRAAVHRASASASVPDSARDVELSAREAEVLGLYASGETAETVAGLLFITRETVLDHIRRIRTKYAAAGRPAVTKVDLFRRAIEDGIVHAGA
ncbi:LuxR C-terminal-related transcriptional regulator [Microbacterium sp. LWH10-1.2]|uniref:LuxR C-terminal-related transcriptional regulator n=1 Tax=unclassified Microbacterium TaxID=2609290 RepID=UPI003139E065